MVIKHESTLQQATWSEETNLRSNEKKCIGHDSENGSGTSFISYVLIEIYFAVISLFSLTQSPGKPDTNFSVSLGHEFVLFCKAGAEKLD